MKPLGSLSHNMLSTPVGCNQEGEERIYSVQISVNSSEVKIRTGKEDMAGVFRPTDMSDILASHKKLPNTSGSGALARASGDKSARMS